MVKVETNSQRAFFELLKAGLWENCEEFQVSGSKFQGAVDWEKVYRLAEEQSVQGLVLQGIERLKNDNHNHNENLNLNHNHNENLDDNGNEGNSQLGLGSTLRSELPSQMLLLQWIGEVQIIEQQNKAMNEFVARLIGQLREEDVYAILVKGQGIAQCYDRPLWRVSGDVDLLLSSNNYEKAKEVLLPLAVEADTEYVSLKHLGMTMKEGFVVELHGMLHCRLSNRIDKMIDDAQHDVFCRGHVRSWDNNGTQVFLPAPDNDVIFIFTHILKHFYIEGIGLRQICDWCRFLWTYRESLNHGLLESRIKEAGLMTEWMAFAALAVEYLGMPIEAMPLYHSDAQGVQEFKKFKRKGERILEFVLKVGNFGHNRQAASGKISSAWHKTKDFIRHAKLFPLDSIKFYCHFVIDGVVVANKNKMYKRSKV